MKNTKSSIFAVATASALAVSLTGCDAVGKITDSIDSGDYDQAVDLYNSSEFSYKEMNKLTEQLSDKLNVTLEKYANGEAEYDDVTSLISALNQMNISKLDSLLISSSAEAANLKASKDSFEQGNEAFDNGNYADAITYYRQVIENDSNYQAASEKISESNSKFKEQILRNVRELTENSEFEKAIEYLNECLAKTNDEVIINTVNDELDNVKTAYADFKLKEIISKADELADEGAYDEAVEYLNSEKYNADSDTISEGCDKKISEIHKIAAVKEAESLADSGDYAEALTTLNEYKEEYNKDDSEVNDLQTEISEQYVEMITEKVTALCEKENYIAALNMLSNAKDVVNSPTFDEMEKKINEVKPIYLYDLKVASSERYEVIDTGEALTDTVGNKYEPGNLFEMSTHGSGWGEESGTASYNLGYNYNTMRGVVSVGDNSDDLNVTLKVEGDDMLIYSVHLDKTTAPVMIDVDVSNVNWLKISLTLDWNPANGTTFYAILSDFTFEK